MAEGVDVEIGAVLAERLVAGEADRGVGGVAEGQELGRPGPRRGRGR
jgi:hypothetical protein